MAKKKNKRGKQGWFSKGINIGLTLLAFSRVIDLAVRKLARGDVTGFTKSLVNEATFGLAGEGGFDIATGMRLYGPPIAAAAIDFTIKRYAARHFPVRG